MLEWWNGLDNLLRILYCVAIPATLLLLLQTILSLAGGLGNGGEGVNFSDTSGLDLPDGGADFDLDLDLDFDLGDIHHGGGLSDGGHGHGVHTDGSAPGDAAVFRLLTLQTFVTFLTVFSWSSIVSLSTDWPPLPSLLLGLALGVVAMLLIAKMVQVSHRLAESGTFNPQNAIGESGKVYLPIPPGGTGKVILPVQGQLSEWDAVAAESQTIPTGTPVRVIDLRSGVLVVEREDPTP